MSDDDLITVCPQCLRASCLQGKFVCAYTVAGTVKKTRRELKWLNLESPDYWKEQK